MEARTMNQHNRKLGEPIPIRLILDRKGELSMADGSPVADYLKTCRKAWKAKGQLEVCITPRLAVEALETDAFLHRNHFA